MQDGDAAGRTDSSAGQADAAYSEGAGCEGAQGSGEFRGTQSGNGYYEGAYYKRPEGDGVYGGRQNTGNYRNPYEESGSQENTSYEQSGSYGTGTSYGQGKAVKEPMSGGMIALIVVLAVLTSPVWIGLLGGFLGVAAGLIAVLFALFLTFLIIGVVFIVVAIALLVTGVTLLFSAPLAALCVIGCGLVLFALGLVGIWVMVALAGLAIPAFVRGIVSLCQKIFHRGGARA